MTVVLALKPSVGLAVFWLGYRVLVIMYTFTHVSCGKSLAVSGQHHAASTPQSQVLSLNRIVTLTNCSKAL